MVASIVREHAVSSIETDLVLEAQKGDRRAFNDLVLIHQDAVYNLAYRILGDADLAEDITQDAFINAYRSMPRFRNGSFRSWVYRIAANACLDELRRRKRHPTLSIESDDRTEEDPLPFNHWSIPQTSPEQMYMRREQGQAIQHALNLLEPDQRAVVVLVDIQEMDYEEAAHVLRIPVGTVKSRLARARVRLRNLIIPD